MRQIKLWGPPLVAALSMVACGGGDPTVPGSGSPSGAPTTKGAFAAVVSFGDSLSDVGTYTPATSATGNGQPPFIGGKFTTNSATGTVWVENVATSLGLMITPAAEGFGATSVPCPIATVYPSLASTCTGYGQGGARVTDPNGVDHAAGFMTVPVVTQIANHLARFTSFKSTDLIFVFAGANDAFTQYAAFGATAAQVQAAQTAGTITAAQANASLFDAQSLAQAGMKSAAQELGGYVRSQILANGGQYVAVMLLPDIAQTPFGQAQPAAAQPVLTSLSQVFNLWLRDSLTGAPVQLIDFYTIFGKVYQNPTQYGIANNTVPACDPAKISAITGGAVTTGSSLFCNSTTGAPYNGLLTGANVSTWLFADDVHPTTGGHALISTAISAQLKAFGWI